MTIDKDLKKGFMLVSGCYLALGIVLLVFPMLSAHLICYALGLITLSLGVISIVRYFTRKNIGEVYRFDFTIGVLLAAAGVFVIARPDILGGLLPIVIGVAILVDSVIKLQSALDLRFLHAKIWWSVLALSCITGGLGVIILLNPFYTPAALTRFIGVTLIVDGLVNLWCFTYLAIKLKNALVDAPAKKAIENAPILTPTAVKTDVQNEVEIAAPSTTPKAESEHENSAPIVAAATEITESKPE